VDEGVLIAPVKAARSGWTEACRAMHEAGDDAPLLAEEEGTAFDEGGWEW